MIHPKNGSYRLGDEVTVTLRGEVIESEPGYAFAITTTEQNTIHLLPEEFEAAFIELRHRPVQERDRVVRRKTLLVELAEDGKVVAVEGQRAWVKWSGGSDQILDVSELEVKL